MKKNNKNKWDKYFTEIEMSKTFIERANAIIDIYLSIFEISIIDIFVSESKDNNDNNCYNLWLFNDEMVMEAKNILLVVDLDASPIRNNILYWNIVSKKVDFLIGPEQSDDIRIELSFSLGANVNGELISNNKNCPYLINIFKKYIIPNIKNR